VSLKQLVHNLGKRLLSKLMHLFVNGSWAGEPLKLSSHLPCDLWQGHLVSY
jgi:hypothetical protein